MKDKRWLVRAGALLILLGYVMPALMVSCAGMSTGRALSFADLSSSPEMNMPLLYLIPAGGLVILILSFLPATSGLQPAALFWGQAAGAAAGLLSILFSMISLNSQLQQYNIEISPQFGLFVLLGGYALVGVGLFLLWPELGSLAEQSWGAAPPRPRQEYPPQMYKPPAPQDNAAYAPTIDPDGEANRYLQSGAAAWLRVRRGSLPQATIPVSDNFTIGRGRDNDLALPDDQSISRQHARLRFSKGAWFIQDAGSKAGILVNGVEVPAKRLASGDEIAIGDYLFEFHC